MTKPAKSLENVVKPKKVLFRPEEYEELTNQERELLFTGYEKAIDVIHRNITPKGFSACSLNDNATYGTDINYRSVWARDGGLTILWTLELDDPAIRECQVQTLRTLLSNQSPAGQIPANVRIETDEPEFCGVGGIASIDSAMWIIIAIYRHALAHGDWSLVDEFKKEIKLTMQWLGAQDSNNDGLIEVPEAGDWTDLFARSYHVLYDEVLWHRSLVCFARMLEHWGETDKAEEHDAFAEKVAITIIRNFWPSTAAEPGGAPVQGRNFTDMQYSLGDARYLVAQVSPFSFSWRCDVYGNLLAYLTNMIDKNRAMMTFRFLWGVGVNDPGPVKNLYPEVQAGAPEWRDYFTVNLLNLPNHYHNGGIWPFIGGMWVRYLHKLGLGQLAKREMVKLTELCREGCTQEWEFNEWHHGVTGRPMGKAFQAWSAASYIRACHDLHVDPDSMGQHV